MRNCPKLKVRLDSSRIARLRILMLLSDHHFRLVSTKRLACVGLPEASASCFPFQCVADLLHGGWGASMSCHACHSSYSCTMLHFLRWSSQLIDSLADLGKSLVHDSHSRAYFVTGQICLSVWIYNSGSDLLQISMYVYSRPQYHTSYSSYSV